MTTKTKKTALAESEGYPMEVQTVEGSNEAKGKFVRFVKNSDNIQWQVWLNNATLAKFEITRGTVLTLDPATVAIASDYKNGALVLDADGQEVPAPIRYEYVAKDGKTVKYACGRGVLDMGVKVLAGNNDKVRKVTAFNPL